MKNIKYFLLLLCVSVFHGHSIFAQVNSAAADSLLPKPVPAVNYSHPQHVTIAGITIEGAQGYDPAVLISLSGLQEGKSVELPGPAFSDAIRKYMRNGFFKNAIIYITKQEGNKVWLQIVLQQRPKIAEIIYNGVKNSEKKDLDAKMGLAVGAHATPARLDMARERAERYFKEKGYTDVQVKISETPDNASQNSVKLLVAVDKKSKIKVSEIDFVGNNNLSDAQLKAAMKKTNETFNLVKHFKSSILELFSSKKFIENDYQEDLTNILNRYHEAGYRDAEIMADTVIRDLENPKRVKIRIKINEGKKYYIAKKRFVGNTHYSSDYLNAVLGIKDGDVYNQKRIEQRLQSDEDAVSNVYYNNGYIFAHIDPVETQVKGDSVYLDFRIMEGPQATVNKVIINGNDLVYENVIRRELYTKPGKLFSREDMMNSYMALNRLDQFDPEKSAPKPIPNPQDGTVDIEYNLVPKRSDKVEFSIGWSQAGLLLRAGLRFGNFSIYNLFHPEMYKGFIPQGDGQTLALDASTNGKFYQQYSIQFMDPWFGGKKPNFFTTSLSYSRQTALDMRFYNNMFSGLGYSPYGYGAYGPGGYGYGGYGNYGYGGYGYDYGNLMENAYNPNQSLNVLGASVGFGKRLEWPDNWFQIYASLNYNFFLLNDWVYETFQGFHNGVANDLNLTLKLSRTSIDNPIFTRRGSDFSIQVSATLPYSLWDKVDYANPALPQELRYRFIEYHKWRFSGKVFTPLLNPTTVQYTPVLMNRVEMGVLGHYSPSKLSPFGTFYMGGDNTGGYMGTYMNEMIGLRGYRNGSIAGNNFNYAYAFMRVTSELRFPILFKGQTNVWALAFIEAGNAWHQISDFNPFNLKRSAGIGIRVTLPMVGLVGVDWGYGFDRPDGSTQRGGSNIHFVIGQEF